MSSKMRYRLALDLGTTSIGWAMLRLDQQDRPCAVIRAGVRIFNDGRVPKTGEALAVQRRLARQQRRTRDRSLRRKNKLINMLVRFGFFPENLAERKSLERLNPYELRAKGLEHQLKPEEFARALFHLAQRRGFKSNRKTDRGDAESGVMKTAIVETKQEIETLGCRTIGEYLYKRLQAGLGTRARLRDKPKVKGGATKSYDLYLERSQVETEFDALWDVQSRFAPELFTQEKREALRDTIFHQRDLRPVKPGRCTLFPEEERAPLALPSQQRFRICQEVNNLRKIDEHLCSIELTQTEKAKLVQALSGARKKTFEQLRKVIGYEGQFSLEEAGAGRADLKGNETTVVIGKIIGKDWLKYSLSEQDKLVLMLLNIESESELIGKLQEEFDLSEAVAKKLSGAPLVNGYGSLSRKAIDLILPFLEQGMTYDKAVAAADIPSHSDLTWQVKSDELMDQLPYYGEVLQRHVGFGTGNPEDAPEVRFGKIANPTVHICLNQLRLVVNLIIKRYGNPDGVVIEVARDLKLSREKKNEIVRKQKKNQEKREQVRKEIAAILECDETLVTSEDIEKWLLWEELNPGNALDRRCPYTGRQISAVDLLSKAFEIEHILPRSRTLDDSRANKTVSYWEANRLKSNLTPWEAREIFEAHGWNYEDILKRAENLPPNKRYRFGADGYKTWLREDSDFLARELTDTQYISRIAREYVSFVCPKNTYVIPGRMTAMLRHCLGLNTILSDDDKKNRNDHRHHAVDACVIGITDRSLLNKIAALSARGEEQNDRKFQRSVEEPWRGFRESVCRAVERINVSHRPEHSYEGQMHDQTAYPIDKNGQGWKKEVKSNGQTEWKKISVIPIVSQKAAQRHGYLSDGTLRPYKGYSGNSNFCIEITVNEKGKWQAEFVTTYDAYQIARKFGKDKLYGKESQSGHKLVMRLMKKDVVAMEDVDGCRRLYLLHKFSTNGVLSFAPINESNVSARVTEGSFKYVSKTAGSLQRAKARQVMLSPLGDRS